MASSVTVRGLLHSKCYLNGILATSRTLVFQQPQYPVSCIKLDNRRSLSTKADVDANIKNYKEGNFDKLPNAGELAHFRKPTPVKSATGAEVQNQQVTDGDVPIAGTDALPHPIWSSEDLHGVEISHQKPEGLIDWAAYYSVKSLRGIFDIISGFKMGKRNEKKWLYRIIFLETVAGVPGMVAAMTRHLHSLRRMQRDYGWIHTLLEEAENERMHLMTALQLKQPSNIFRIGVLFTQATFVTMFSVSYLISPKYCHRFVGYLEEEAVKTYTKCLEDIESGCMQHWKTQASPELATSYWKLPADATMKDVILAIRADEAHHRLVNHTLASMKETDYNPYKPGK